MNRIPVLSASGSVSSYTSIDTAASLPRCRQVRNKRGHITAVRASADTPWTQDLIARGKTSKWGQSFEQSVATGHVWALKGVRGSRA